MKLLLTTPIFPPEIGGPATYSSNLARQLTPKHQLTILTFTPNPRSIKQTNIKSIPQFRIPIIGALLRQTTLFLSLIRHLPKTQSIYSQDPLTTGFTAAITTRLFSKPHVIKFVGDIPWETASHQKHTQLDLVQFHTSQLPIKYQLQKFFQKVALQLSYAIVTPSEFLKQFLVDHYQIPSQKITIIPNPVNSTQIKTKKLPYQLIYVGRLVAWKNIDQIIQAVSLARKKHPWRLLILGSGPQLHKLNLLCQKLKASTWVEFLGTKSHAHTQKLIAQSQKLILYSTYEGQPHVAIEAIIQNTPIVASRIPPHQELLSKHQPLVPLNNPHQLAHAINANSTIPTRFRRSIGTNHTWDHHLKLLTPIIFHEI